MNRALIGRLLWKEYRALRPGWVGLLATGAALAIAGGLAMAGGNTLLARLQIATYLPVFVASLFAITTGVWVFAHERESYARRWVERLQPPAATETAAKFLVAILATATLGAAVLALARFGAQLSPAPKPPPHSLPSSVLIPAELLAFGLLGGAAIRGSVAAAFAGLGAWLASFAIVAAILPPELTPVVRLFIALGALAVAWAIGAKWFRLPAFRMAWRPTWAWNFGPPRISLETAVFLGVGSWGFIRALLIPFLPAGGRLALSGGIAAAIAITAWVLGRVRFGVLARMGPTVAPATGRLIWLSWRESRAYRFAALAILIIGAWALSLPLFMTQARVLSYAVGAATEAPRLAAAPFDPTMAAVAVIPSATGGASYGVHETAIGLFQGRAALDGRWAGILILIGLVTGLLAFRRRTGGEGFQRTRTDGSILPCAMRAAVWGAIGVAFTVAALSLSLYGRNPRFPAQVLTGRATVSFGLNGYGELAAPWQDSEAHRIAVALRWAWLAAFLLGAWCAVAFRNVIAAFIAAAMWGVLSSAWLGITLLLELPLWLALGGVAAVLAWAGWRRYFGLEGRSGWQPTLGLAFRTVAGLFVVASALAVGRASDFSEYDELTGKSSRLGRRWAGAVRPAAPQPPRDPELLAIRNSLALPSQLSVAPGELSVSPARRAWQLTDATERELLERNRPLLPMLHRASTRGNFRDRRIAWQRHEPEAAWAPCEQDFFDVILPVLLLAALEAEGNGDVDGAGACLSTAYALTIHFAESGSPRRYERAINAAVRVLQNIALWAGHPKQTPVALEKVYSALVNDYESIAAAYQVAENRRVRWRSDFDWLSAGSPWWERRRDKRLLEMLLEEDRRVEAFWGNLEWWSSPNPRSWLPASPARRARRTSLMPLIAEFPADIL
ncbi:MAG TPA: hypothetical protein VNC50_20310, partial [Planctomycetia bacterium]|nr:hypothetical protein [Planctomycetia bacterium]